MSFVWPYKQVSLKQVKFFCDVMIRNQHLLWLPEFKFFKDFIEVFGGRLVIPPKKLHTPKTPESEPDSDLEIDNEGCVEQDELSPDQKMGDPNKEVTDEDKEKAIEKRSEALSQLAQDNAEKALEIFTEAIELDPTSALLFAKRGFTYLKLAKPEACIKDCTRAIELNPDCAQAFKYRGRAVRLLGEWLYASFDLERAQALDCADEETRDWLKEVSPKAKRIKEHLLKKTKKKMMKAEEVDYARRIKQQEEYAKARAAGQTSEEDAIAHAKAAEEYDKFFSNPDFKNAMIDTEIATAIKDISSSPGKLRKYANNRKVMAFLNMMCSRMSEMGLNGEKLHDFHKWGAFKSVPEVKPEGAASQPKFHDFNLD